MPDLSHGPGQNETTRLKAYQASLIHADAAEKRIRKKDIPMAAHYVAIFENNCFKIRNRYKDGDVDAWAVFAKASLLNHSVSLWKIRFLYM